MDMRRNRPEVTPLDSGRRATKSALKWFSLYPEWAEKAACLGWMHRNEKAWIICHGHIVGKQTPDFEVLLGEDRFSG